MSTTAKNEVEAAREELRNLLPPGTLVRTIHRHTSRSGMTHAISPVFGDRDLTYLAVRAVPGWKRDERYGGIKQHGGGMDMGFGMVYTLSRTLYPSGHDCTGSSEYGSSCPSNDHSNGDRDYTPHVHSDGGYALRQAWL